MEDTKTVQKFKDYVHEGYLDNAPKEKRDGYEDKLNHSLFVMDEALAVDALFTKYSPNYRSLLTLESLFHDVGRFEQLKQTGTFADSEIGSAFPGLSDHGDLGAQVIKEHGLLPELIPETRLYDEEVQRVIRDHSKLTTEKLNRTLLEYLKVFAEYDLYELFKSNKTDKEKAALGRINTAIVQDVDRLDIFRKIVRGIWVPATTDDSIDPEIWKRFKEGRMPSIAEIKAAGKWNANVGHLVRLSFINQMNLAPVLVRIKEEKLIDEVFAKHAKENPDFAANAKNIEEAYGLAKETIDKKLAESEDGMLLK